MRNKLLVLIFIFTLLPVISWGQSDVTDIDLGSAECTGYTIKDNGIYHFTGRFIGTPEQKINDNEVKAVIYIKEGVIATIILENVNISLTGKNQSPLCARDAKEITLKIKGINTLSIVNRAGNSPGLWVPEGKDSNITIQNKEEGIDGTLIAEGAEYFPGIGRVLTDGESNITIKNGIIKATGGDYGIGIEVSSNSTLTIEGGIITAQGSRWSAGIGGGYNKDGGTCIITGGTVTATGGTLGAGIGGGSGGSGGTCTITGGTVTATGGKNVAGIGNGSNNSGTSIFSTKDNQGNSGNAFIITNSITDNSDENKDDWSGVIFEDNTNGKVYGTPTIQTDAKVPAGGTLTIDNRQTLTIDKEITLTNEGTIDNNGTIINNGKINLDNGTLNDNGKITSTVRHDVKITLQEGSTNLSIAGIKISAIATDNKEKDYAAISNSEGSIIFNVLHNNELTFMIDIGSIESYSIDGENYTDDSPSILVDKDLNYYFRIKPNQFNLKTPEEINITYGDKIDNFDLHTLVTKAEKGKEFAPVSFMITEGSLLDGLSFDHLTSISGKPKAATIGEQEIKIKVSNGFPSLDKELTLAFNVAPKELTVDLPQIKVLYKDEVGTYKPTISFGNTITDETPAYEYEYIQDADKLFYYKTIKLVDNDAFIASNYTIKDQDKYKIKLIEANAADQKAVITGSYNNTTDWYTSAVTLKAPEGFTISSSNIRLLSDPQQEITIDKGGQYQYILKRDYSNLEIKGNINIDIIPPFITLSQDNLDFELTVSDEMSGIGKVLLDGTLITLTDNTYNGHSTAGNHTIEVFDVAGNKTTMSFTLEKKDDDPYIPPYEPDPVITYTVTLPAVEGITTDPVAGDYSVEEYSSFSFTVTVAEGYREQSVPVVKVNGSVFEPADTDGHYKIKFIRSDQSIIVEGILADTPTANETLGTPAFELRTEGHTLCITLPKPSLCRLFDPSGRLICSRQLTPGINRLEGLAAGIYFVVVEREGVRKIVVQ